MGLPTAVAARVREHLGAKVSAKLQAYNPETAGMPFHDRLFGRRNVATFSLMHSLNTTLGMSVFEEIGRIIASGRFAVAESQYRGLKGYLSEGALEEIGHIVDDLVHGRATPDRDDETTRVVMKACRGVLRERRNPRVDLFLKTEAGEEIYIDVKTAKPNKGEFAGMKRTLLEWVAVRASSGHPVQVRTLLGIPYNPYEPRPYDRWTGRGLFDHAQELLVGKSFWDFLGGDGAYEDLLVIFAEVGVRVQKQLTVMLDAIGS